MNCPSFIESEEGLLINFKFPSQVRGTVFYILEKSYSFPQNFTEVIVFGFSNSMQHEEIIFIICRKLAIKKCLTIEWNLEDSYALKAGK